MSIEVMDSNYEEEVVNSELPVFIDFWAAWCGPCIMMEGIIEELSQEYSGKLKVVKVNVDNASAAASEHGIMSIPTFIILNKGQEVARFSGAVPKDNLTEWIDSHLNK